MLNELKTAVIVTLGCRLNQADTALLGSRLKKLGFRLESLQKNKTIPDLIVVNSCAVTAVAVKKTRHAVKALRTKYPGAFIVLTGCAASVDHGEFNDCSDFDLLLNNEEKKDLIHILTPYLTKDCIRKNTPEQKTCKCMPEQYPDFQGKRAVIIFFSHQRNFKNPGRLRKLLHILHCSLCPGAGKIPGYTGNSG